MKHKVPEKITELAKVSLYDYAFLDKLNSIIDYLTERELKVIYPCRHCIYNSGKEGFPVCQYIGGYPCCPYVSKPTTTDCPKDKCVHFGVRMPNVKGCKTVCKREGTSAYDNFIPTTPEQPERSCENCNDYEFKQNGRCRGTDTMECWQPQNPPKEQPKPECPRDKCVAWNRESPNDCYLNCARNPFGRDNAKDLYIPCEQPKETEGLRETWESMREKIYQQDKEIKRLKEEALDNAQENYLQGVRIKELENKCFDKQQEKDALQLRIKEYQEIAEKVIINIYHSDIPIHKTAIDLLKQITEDGEK